MEGHDMRIVLVDDHAIVRKGLRVLLEGVSGFEIVGEAGNGADAVALVRECRPDIVVIDIAMPGLNGIDATRRILEEQPGTAVIALTANKEARFAGELLKAGGRGYVCKESAFEELEQAIRQVAEGKTYLSPTVAGSLVDVYVRGAGAGDRGAFSILSEREREVLQLLAEGLSVKRIALRLGISAKTVQTFRSRMMAKLGKDNLAELTKYAIAEGLVSLHS
jgi:DNA-binding NarL/FixJ family response regulator